MSKKSLFFSQEIRNACFRRRPTAAPRRGLWHGWCVICNQDIITTIRQIKQRHIFLWEKVNSFFLLLETRRRQHDDMCLHKVNCLIIFRSISMIDLYSPHSLNIPGKHSYLLVFFMKTAGAIRPSSTTRSCQLNKFALNFVQLYKCATVHLNFSNELIICICMISSSLLRWRIRALLQ